MQTHAIDIRQLVKGFRDHWILKGIDLQVKQGEIFGLVGMNGAGKTTTFYMTVGMVKPDVGKVLLNEEDMTGYPMHLRARKGVGYLPQEPSIFRKLTVKQNILAILETLAMTKEEQAERA